VGQSSPAPRSPAEASVKPVFDGLFTVARILQQSFLDSFKSLFENHLYITTLWLRLAPLYFTSEAFFFLQLRENSIGGARAVLVNRLTKQLYTYSSLKYALTERHLGWDKAGRSYYFLLLTTPELCENTFLGVSSVEPFYFISFGRK
jgi:hypothetical protein